MDKIRIYIALLFCKALSFILPVQAQDTSGSNSNRYNTQYSYDCMGNITSLSRNGLLDDWIGTGGQSPVPSIIFQISMRTIKILMILMLVSSPAMAFNQKVDTVVVSHDSSQVLQIIVTIDNTDNEALWILLKNKK